jgi:hypothetical protein
MNWGKLCYYLLILQTINSIVLLDVAMWRLWFGGE